MEEACVHLDGEPSLVYRAHMVLTFSPASLSPPLPSGWQDQAVTMGNSGWATFSADLSPVLCLDLQPFKKCNYLPYHIINRYWSGGHRVKDSVVSANVNSDKDEKVFDHWHSWKKPRMKHWSRHSSEGGKQRRERHQQVLCRTSWLCS